MCEDKSDEKVSYKVNAYLNTTCQFENMFNVCFFFFSMYTVVRFDVEFLTSHQE